MVYKEQAFHIKALPMEEWDESTEGRSLHVASNMYLGHFNLIRMACSNEP